MELPGSPSAKLPVTVLGGYLGVGKTTLLNHLLRHAGGRRLAVLVNDFGDVGIDVELIEAREGEVLSLSGGCVCCSFGSDLIGALNALERRLPRPDAILIETSGVALPEGVGHAVGLVDTLALDAVIVVVDAGTVRQRAADRYVGDTVTAQLAQADLIVVNKLDLADGTGGEGLHQWLHRLAPAARLVQACHGQVPVELILGPGDLRAARTLAETWVGRGCPGGSPPPQGRRLQRTAPPASERFVSASFRTNGRVDLALLATLLVNPSLGVLRAKGLMRDCDGEPNAFHLVGARAETRQQSAYSDLAQGRLVCIGLCGSLDEARIADCLQATIRPG